MRFSRPAAFACTFLFALTLCACSGPRDGCGAQSIPLGPVPAGTPIPVQPMPQNSGLTANAFVGIDFTINATGTVTTEHVRISSRSTVVDNTALQIVQTTLFKAIDINCEGQPVRSGYVGIEFTQAP